MAKLDIKEYVRGDAKFCYYRKDNLYYECENGYVFPIPIDDTGDASFPAQERAMMMMRWIRKALENEE
jgi:hypothetical protein